MKLEEIKKENIIDEFIKMIENSWTYNKMTKMEKEALYKTFDNCYIKTSLKGTNKQRWNILQSIYHGFLMGLGYNNNPTWREIDETPLF